MFELIDLDRFSGVFRAESDRACAVLGAAYVDECVKRMFQRGLDSYRSEILSERGALGNFGARTMVARALSWISEDVYRDLYSIGKIRNKFAHSADLEINFEKQSIKDLCGNLIVANTLIEAHAKLSRVSRNFSPAIVEKWASNFQSPRQRFEITVEIIAQHLREIEMNNSCYVGPDLREEVWALGMREPKIQITATVSAP